MAMNFRYQDDGTGATDIIPLHIAARYQLNQLIANSQDLVGWLPDYAAFTPYASILNGQEYVVEVTMKDDAFEINFNNEETATYLYSRGRHVFKLPDITLIEFTDSTSSEDRVEIIRANKKKCVCAESHVINGHFEFEAARFLMDISSLYKPVNEIKGGIRGWERENDQSQVYLVDRGFDGSMVQSFWGKHMKNASRHCIGLQNSVDGRVSGFKTTLMKLEDGKLYKLRVTASNRGASLSQNPVFHGKLGVFINGIQLFTDVLPAEEEGNVLWYEFRHNGADGDKAELVLRNVHTISQAGGDSTIFVDDVMVFEKDESVKDVSKCPAVEDLAGAFADTCVNCSVGFKIDHCNLTCDCPDGDGTSHTTTVNLSVCATPTNLFGRLMCPGNEGDKSMAALSAADKSRILRHQRLVCGDANEIKFSRMYKNVSGRYHLDFDDNNEIHFSSKGTSGVNIALMNKARVSGMKAEQLTEGFTGAFDLFIGPESEPVAHFADCLGCKPKEIVNLGLSPLIKAATNVDVVLKIEADGDGSNVKLGRKDSEGTITWVMTVFVADYENVDEAIFTYGYGDMECKCPATEQVVIRTHAQGTHPGSSGVYTKDLSYNNFTVDLRTMSARVTKLVEPTNSNPFTYKAFETANCDGKQPEGGVVSVDLTGTPFQIPAEDVPADAFTEGGFVAHGGAEYPAYRNGNLILWSSGGRLELKCQSLQKCEIRCFGTCGHCGFVDTSHAPFNDPTASVSFRNDYRTPEEGNSIRVEYVDGYVDGCTGEQGLCEVGSGERVACENAATRAQCQAQGCCFDEASEECFKQASALTQ
jgi:hypothetical protein